MSGKAERELAIAKETFAETLDSFSPVRFIQEKPLMAAGIALAAGTLIGLMRFPKVKKILLSAPLLGLIKRMVNK